MKRKDLEALRAKNKSELKNAVLKAHEELFLLKQDLSQNKLKNTRLIFWKKKEIAKLLTILREREFENAKSA